MPTKVSKFSAANSHALLLAYIKMSPKPVPVYYECKVLKVICSDDSKLIGVFGPDVTIEELRYNAGIQTHEQKRTQRAIDKLQALIGKQTNTRVIKALETAVKEITKLQ